MADEMYSNIRDFYFPVLHIIRDMGGQARANEVCDRFLSRHRHQLDSSFFTEIKDGDVKWHDWVHRAHYQLKQMGYLRDPQRGIWALTDKPWPTNKAGFERVGSGARAVRSAAPKSAAADRPSSRIAAPVRSAARTETAGPTDDQPVHQVRYSTIAKESTSRFVPVSASEPLAAGSTRREPNVDEGAARHVGEPRQSPSVRETKHVTRSGSSDRDLRVQSAITSVSFPDSLERLRAMGQKWLGLVGQDWITDMDVLSDFPVGATVPWIAPKWLTEGDILFFYHTKSAANLIRSLRKQARTATLTGGWKRLGLVQSAEDMDRLNKMLERADEAASVRSGTIFAFAVVGGRPERIMDELKHFKGTIYAPITGVHVFKRPLASEEFDDIVAIGQNTTTAVYGDQLGGLQERLARHNVLPEPLASARPSGLGFRDVTADNWDSIACRADTRFIDEEQLRTYFLDFLLDEVKDARSPVYRECACVKGGQSSGRADYFIRLGGRLVPIEAKLNVLTSPDISEQVRQYIHVDSFVPIKGREADVRVAAGDCSMCVVVDQAGLYVTVDGRFVGCSPQKPLFIREELDRPRAGTVRSHLLGALR